jgi:hypothetical protein
LGFGVEVGEIQNVPIGRRFRRLYLGRRGGGEAVCKVEVEEIVMCGFSACAGSKDWWKLQPPSEFHLNGELSDQHREDLRTMLFDDFPELF